MAKAYSMRVINRRIRKEGNTAVVTDLEVRKDVMEFQRGVPAIAGPFKTHTIEQ
jgi:hypothetical protein